MSGYWFIWIEYKSGRCAIKDKRYTDETSAEHVAAKIREKHKNDPAVKRVRTGYQCGIEPIDIKKYI